MAPAHGDGGAQAAVSEGQAEVHAKEHRTITEVASEEKTQEENMVLLWSIVTIVVYLVVAVLYYGIYGPDKFGVTRSIYFALVTVRYLSGMQTMKSKLKICSHLSHFIS